MAEALFYHLTRKPLEEALPDLLLRALERRWRALVRCGSAARAEDLNRSLWTFRDESFLPHGGRGDPEPERQPIYLTDGPEAPNAPDVLFLVDGAAAAPEEVARYARCCLMFDGRDPEAVAAARRAWAAMVAAEIPAVYWAQSDQGRWEKRAEKRPEQPANG